MTQKKVGMYATFGTDQQAEENGVPVEIQPGLTITIRSVNSDAHRRWDANRAKKQRQMILLNNGVLPPETVDRNDIDRCAEVLVTGWVGATDKNGNDLPFTVENARRVFTDLPALRRNVIYVANTDESYKPSVPEVVDGALGNSAPPSTAN